MKAAGLFNVWAILALSILGVYGKLTCNIHHARAPNNFSDAGFTKNIRESIEKPIERICLAAFPPGNQDSFVNYHSGPFVLTITRTDTKKSDENCQIRLNDIIEQCNAENNVWVGTLSTDGLLYEIYYSENPNVSDAGGAHGAGSSPPANGTISQQEDPKKRQSRSFEPRAR